MAQIIKTTGETIEVSPKNTTDFSLEEMKAIVEGWIQVVWFYDGSDRIMVLNENGKLDGLEYNAKATQIAREGRAIDPTDFIVGNVLICKQAQVK